MNDNFFGGSYGGDDARLQPGSRLECKICWYVYDPVLGDAYWQVPAGTPFAELPPHWSCPNCDGSKRDFLLLEQTS